MFLVKVDHQWHLFGLFCHSGENRKTGARWSFFPVGGKGLRVFSSSFFCFVNEKQDTPNFSVRKVNIRNSAISGTAYLDFNDAVVPVKNLLGKEGDGFKMTVHNFNHERIYISIITARMARICLEGKRIRFV